MISELPSPSLRKDLEAATARYQTALPESPAVAYLQGRVISGRTAQLARLGYVADVADPMHGRLAIPYLTRAGVVNIKYRRLDGGDPKYLYWPGLDSTLYGVEDFFTTAGPLVITEGEVDCLSIKQAGVRCVGYPGVQNFKAHHARCFYGEDLVVIVADGDTPGRDAAKAISKEIGRWAERVRVVRCPDGADANSVLVEQGEQALRQLIGV